MDAGGGELSSPNHSFANEQEGTWSYRVRSKTVVPAYKIEPEQTVITPWSNTLENVVVDQTAPNAPTAAADRAPDYAGGGGWYKDTVTVSFTDNGDPLLSDGSPGSGVDPSSIPAPQTFSTDGSYLASGTVADNAGNVSEPGSQTVQVDATAPSAEASCPAPVSIGAKGVKATVTALDGQSGLAKDPSGSYPIDTSTAGVKTVEVTAIDNVGHETTASCSTLVGYTQVISGNVKGKLTVKSGAGDRADLERQSRWHGDGQAGRRTRHRGRDALGSGENQRRRAAADLRRDDQRPGQSRENDGLGRDRRRDGICPSNSLHGQVTLTGNTGRGARRRQHDALVAEGAQTTPAARRSPATASRAT